jgi:6-pyruvoyltetrahydropterin/6-carboxytetrahydropterin synthase
MVSHWALGKQFRFQARNQQPRHHDSSTLSQENHWVGIVYISSKAFYVIGNNAEMNLDAADIKPYLKPLLDNYLDQHCLAQTTGLEQPTSQELAKWIFEQLVQRGLPGLLGVKIHNETNTSSCLYSQSVRTGFQLAMASTSIAVA